MVPISGLEPNVLAFHLNGGVNGEKAQGLYVIFNANPTFQKVPLPPGKWNVNIDHQRAGVNTLATAQTKVSVAPYSAMVLVKEAAHNVKRTLFRKRIK